MPNPVDRALGLKKDQREEGSRRSLSAMIVSMLSSAPLTAAFVITFSVVVTVFAINQLLQYSCGPTKAVAMLPLVVLPTALAKIMLTKRARWSFPMGGIGGGLIIAAAAYATPYLVSAICYAISSESCASVAGGLIATTSVAVAAIVACSGKISTATER